MFGRRKKCALLIDFDNVLGMTSGEFTTSIAKWMEWLEDGAFDSDRLKRKFLIKRVYWNPLYDRYRDVFEAAGFEAFSCGAIAKSKKSSADIVITLDAVDIAADTKGLQEIILLTSDTDFVPVVNRLQERELEVVAMGHEQTQPPKFIASTPTTSCCGTISWTRSNTNARNANGSVSCG